MPFKSNAQRKAVMATLTLRGASIYYHNKNHLLDIETGFNEEEQARKFKNIKTGDIITIKDNIDRRKKNRYYVAKKLVYEPEGLRF